MGLKLHLNFPGGKYNPKYKVDKLSVTSHVITN